VLYATEGFLLRDETAVLAFHQGCGWDLEIYRGGVPPRSYQKLEAVNRDKASCPTMKDRKAKVQPAE
jgi:hypothetical protein